MIINPRLSSIFLITGESAISPLVMTPLQWGRVNELIHPQVKECCRGSKKLGSWVDDMFYKALVLMVSEHV